jgi:RNA polymerase sigma-70 factor (ECF subfamily)
MTAAEGDNHMLKPDRAVVLETQRGVHPEDAEVIARSGEEPELFAALFRRHAPTIQRYITRRIGPDAAEDVVAETFLVAFDQRSRYDSSRLDARPWLYGIASNLVGQHRRAEVRQLKAFGRSGVDPIMAGFSDSADARIGAEAIRKRLAAALGRLRPAYREALLLIAWGDLTYEEAANALSVPVGTVRSRISRARKVLRAALGDVDPTALTKDEE